MNKYRPLEQFLLDQESSEIFLKFDEIEALINRLPASAYQFEWWWGNQDWRTTRQVQAKAWGRAGFEADANLKDRTVTFRSSHAE